MKLIEVQGVGKAFRQYPSARHRIFSWLGLPAHGIEEHWVLKDINFHVAPGEAVGLVGENGAGKSTLLKMIAGTLAPSAGSVTLNGDIRAILELGMGFHGEFTGRENARHGLSMMGLSSAEIEQLMPEVEAFAEVGEYFDKPLRTYSSGMQMRVTFAVATVKRPQVLIVDEALSVGDAYFQHKSFDRIREMQRDGTSLLIVSHDRGAIQRVCDRVILLEHGQVVLQGEPEAVMDYYNASLANKENQRHKVQTRQLQDGRVQTTSGNGDAEITQVQLVDAASGDAVEVAAVGQKLALIVEITAHVDLPELVVGYLIKDRLRHDIFGTNSHLLKQELTEVAAGSVVSYRFEFDCNLGEGSYSFSIAAHADDTHIRENYHWKDLAYTFEVLNTGQPRFIGSAWIPPTLTLSRP